MSKIYIEYDKTTGSVKTQHFMPFDSVNGIKNLDGTICTENELLARGGILVDSIPTPENIENKDFALYVNLSTKTLYYVYVDKIKTQFEINNELQSQNAQIILTLVTGGLM